MRGKGSDQGGRWPVGIWFALVGVSAGTVASFAMVGWAFTRGLYDGPGGAVPFERESETMVIEAEVTPDDQGAAGADGDDTTPEGPALEAGTPSAAEPQAAPAPAEPEEAAETEAPDPRLVPVEENARECENEESDADESGGDRQGERGGGRDEEPVLELEFEQMGLPIEDLGQIEDWEPFVSLPRPKG